MCQGCEVAGTARGCGWASDEGMHAWALVQAGIKVASRAGARTIWAQVRAAVLTLDAATLASRPS